VQFTKDGLFKVDNSDVPAFVIANSVKIRLLGWRIQYVGRLPIAMGGPLALAKDRAGYYDNGSFVATSWPSVAFSDSVLTQWLAKNRGIRFAQAAPWGGFSNTSAIFYIVGNTSDMEVRDFKIFVAPEAKGSQFIPLCFSLMGGWKSNQANVITHQTPMTPEQYAVPNHLTFSDIDLDGYYFGWQGPLQNSVIEHVRAHRYGDLQDDNGGNSGGVAKWFAPPHLLYLNYDLIHPGFENRNIRILDVIDYGNRVGVARDRGGNDTGSGYANSLKIGAIDSEVDGYKSYRPDGLLDLLPSTNLKISNVEGTYDSSFIHDLYPAIRFPQGPYHNVTLANFTLVDKAPITSMPPVGSFWNPSSSQLVLTNFKVTLNSWAKASGPDPKALTTLCPHLGGSNNKIIDVQFIVSGHIQKCS
jgi:hypothetical protein